MLPESDSNKEKKLSRKAQTIKFKSSQKSGKYNLYHIGNKL